MNLQVINEEEKDYDSDDSLKDLNWLGGLNPAKLSNSSKQSNRRVHTPHQQQPQQQQQQQQPSPSCRSTAAKDNANVATKPPPSACVRRSQTREQQLQLQQQQQQQQQSQPSSVASTVAESPQSSTSFKPPLSLQSSIPVSQMISHPPWVTQQKETRRINRLKRPPFSYVALCCMSLASNESLTLPLSQIYKWIEDNFHYYARPECYQDWRSSIRHTLSLYTFFQSAPVMVGRKTVPTWRLDVTECERRDLVRLVQEYKQHLNSQFISEWTSRLVYAEQRSHRRGAYDRQASRFKTFSTLRSRSSSTDTLTSTHSNSTSATGQSGYQSFTPDSGISSNNCKFINIYMKFSLTTSFWFLFFFLSAVSGPTLTINETELARLTGALTAIPASNMTSTSVPSPVHSSNNNHQLHFSTSQPVRSPLVVTTSSGQSPMHTPVGLTSEARFDSGPGITIIRIPPTTAKFGFYVLGPQSNQLSQIQQHQHQQTLQFALPTTPSSEISEGTSPLFDLTNQNGELQATEMQHQQQQQQQQLQQHIEFSQQQQHQQHQQSLQQQEWNQQQVDWMNNMNVDTPAAMSVDSGTGGGGGGGDMASNMADDVDFTGSMDLDLSLQDFGAAAELFSDTSNIDFASIIDGTMDTPRCLMSNNVNQL